MFILVLYGYKAICPNCSPVRGGTERGRTDGRVSHLLGEVGELAAASAEVVLDLDSGGSVRRGRPGGGGGASI